MCAFICIYMHACRMHTGSYMVLTFQWRMDHYVGISHDFVQVHPRIEPLLLTKNWPKLTMVDFSYGRLQI